MLSKKIDILIINKKIELTLWFYIETFSKINNLSIFLQQVNYLLLKIRYKIKVFNC